MIQLSKLPGSEGLPLPQKMSEAAAGYDLYAAVPQPVVLEPGERVLVPTGIAIAMPRQLEGQIRPRSGLALKHGITCLNTPGTIDADYRGEIKVLLINLGQKPVTLKRGDRVAQLVFQEVAKTQFIEVDQLSTSRRGEGSFGHTGR